MPTKARQEVKGLWREMRGNALWDLVKTVGGEVWAIFGGISGIVLGLAWLYGKIASVTVDMIGLAAVFAASFGLLFVGYVIRKGERKKQMASPESLNRIRETVGKVALGETEVTSQGQRVIDVVETAFVEVASRAGDGYTEFVKGLGENNSVAGIVRFENKARGSIGDLDGVRAQIDYVDESGKKSLVEAGCWLDAAFNSVELRARRRQALILCVVGRYDEFARAVEDGRHTVVDFRGIRDWVLEKQWYEVRVRLIIEGKEPLYFCFELDFRAATISTM